MTDKLKAAAKAREEKRIELEKKHANDFSDKRGGTFVIINSVRVHESDMTPEQREQFGLPPLSEDEASTSPDEEVSNDA